MDDHAVVIAGGGPTGLMLAAELALAGVEALVVERRADQHVDGLRAGGLHPRTIEVLDQRGVAERFVSAGTKHPAAGYAMIPLDLSDFPTRHPYLLALWQKDFEPILAAWVDELGLPVRRGCEVVGLAEDVDGVVVELSDGTSVRAQHLVGCDGGRSVVRKAAGIAFEGIEASTAWVIAEVEMDGEPELGMHPDGAGNHGISRLDDCAYRVLIAGRDPQADDPTIDDLRDGIVEVYGTDFGLRSARWVSRFTDTARQAATYRKGPVLVAGDAAHIHPPQGGQGLNIGVQDAVNLGWKLAQVVRGTSTTDLLDTYHDERHPVGARVLENTMAQVALGTPDERHESLRKATAELLAMDEPRRRVAAMMTGLDVHYDLGVGHPLLGRRMPDLDLDTDGGPATVFALLHAARPVLLDLGADGDLDVEPWADRVQVVGARTGSPWQLPVLGPVPPPAAVLVRPDGHVAWAGDRHDDDLTAALTRWFGPPRRA